MRIGEFEPESPLMNAGGLLKTVEDVERMAQTGVGAVLAGSFTLEPRAGNGADGQRVYYHDETTGVTYNSLGMPNMGIEALAKVLPAMVDAAHDRDKPFILNLAPVSDQPQVEVAKMFRILRQAGIRQLDGVELNASCPNIVTGNGARHELLSHHPEQLEVVIDTLQDVAHNEVEVGAIWTRISPFQREQDAYDLVEAMSLTGVDGVSAFNTFPGGKPLKDDVPILEVPGGTGGMSGPGMRHEAEEQMRWLMQARSAFGAGFDIIGSNGVMDAPDLRKRLALGASMVSATTLFWESTNWQRTVHEVLEEYTEIT